MENQKGEFCPVCKFLIEDDAESCPNCGTVLFGGYEAPSTTVQLNEDEAKTLAEIETIEESEYPEKGIAIYLYKHPRELICIQEEEEFTLGRRTGITSNMSETILVDLGPFNGFPLGVSRRHALIRKTEQGYEITDLESTNGSQLNGLRMVPNQAYTLKNGSLYRAGNLMLYFVFHPKPQG